MRPQIQPGARFDAQHRNTGMTEHGIDLGISLLPVLPVMALVIELDDKSDAPALIYEWRSRQISTRPG